jgi:ribose-phosphate pyrophosphokinase
MKQPDAALKPRHDGTLVGCDANERVRERLVIIGGHSHPEFVRAVCHWLGHPAGRVQTRTFSDGAIEVKLEDNVRGRDVFVFQSGQANPNDHLMELLFLVDAARRASARNITAVLPYFAYAKGDKKDEPRVSIRARVVADALEVAGAQRVLTVHLHAGQLQGLFHIPVDNLYTSPVITDELLGLIRKRRDPVPGHRCA